MTGSAHYYYQKLNKTGVRTKPKCTRPLPPSPVDSKEGATDTGHSHRRQQKACQMQQATCPHHGSRIFEARESDGWAAGVQLKNWYTVNGSLSLWYRYTTTCNKTTVQGKFTQATQQAHSRSGASPCHPFSKSGFEKSEPLHLDSPVAAACFRRYILILSPLLSCVPT